MSFKGFRNFTKRALDLIVVLVSLLFIAPLLLIIALLVRIKLGSPVLFRQQRPGLNCQPFTIFKFRTMRNSYDSQGNLLPDKDRQTRFGHFLRKSSLDELPELFNIVRGEMSLVGPRPLLMKYLYRYDEVQMRRHEVKPGLTGWAQINGRNGITWERKLNLDVWYIDNWSLALDIKILVLTVWTVLKREGISQPGEVGMAEFNGSGVHALNHFTEPASKFAQTAYRQHPNGLQKENLYFDAEFKANVVLDLISGIKKTDEICREHNLDPYTVGRWYGEFLDKMANVFETDPHPAYENRQEVVLEKER